MIVYHYVAIIKQDFCVNAKKLVCFLVKKKKNGQIVLKSRIIKAQTLHYFNNTNPVTIVKVEHD